jgi:hypothetical protein
MSENLILTHAWRGRKGRTRGVGTKTYMPAVCNISSEHIAERHTSLGLSWTELKQLCLYLCSVEHHFSSGLDFEYTNTVTQSLHGHDRVRTECFGSGSSCWFLLLQLQRFNGSGVLLLTALKIEVLCLNTPLQVTSLFIHVVFSRSKILNSLCRTVVNFQVWGRLGCEDL